MRHTKHYFRISFLLIGAFLLFLLFRAFMIPHSFGDFGFFRGDNVQEQMDPPITFAPKETCADCHPDVAQKHSGGQHQPVQCQNCHEPLSVHVNLETGDFLDAMPIDRSTKLCLRCHRQLPSRRSDFPQIDLEKHLPTDRMQNPEACVTCHNPHSPFEFKEPSP